MPTSETPPTQPPPKGEKVTSHCPMCDKRDMVKHCDIDHCTWAHCRNKDCDATLDIRRRLGHCLIDGGRVRLTFGNGRWAERQPDVR